MVKRPRKKPEIGVRIKALREQRGMTQRDLADLAGLSSVAMIESRGDTMRYETAKALAGALGVSIEEIYGDEEPQPSEALSAFLRSPGAADVTPEEVEQLRRLRARGKRPTEDTYYWALKMLRSMGEEDK